jgi:hypothetical protein
MWLSTCWFVRYVVNPKPLWLSSQSLLNVHAATLTSLVLTVIESVVDNLSHSKAHSLVVACAD